MASAIKVLRDDALAARHPIELTAVEPGAKAAPGARKDNGAKPGCRGEFGTAGGNGLKHLLVEGVYLVGPIQADIGHAIIDTDPDSSVHLPRLPDQAEFIRSKHRASLPMGSFFINSMRPG